MLSSPLKLLIAASSIIAPLAQCVSVSGNRLLVVDEDGRRGEFSQFLKGIEDRGFDVSFETAREDSFSLFVRGKRLYDHLLLLPPKKTSYGSSLTPQNLLQFINTEGNILALLSPSTLPDTLQELAKEVDIDLPKRNFQVVDHTNYDRLSASTSHDIVVVPPPKKSEFRKNYFSVDAPIAFNGTGSSLGASPLVNSILPAPRTAYAYDVAEDAVYADSPFAAGFQLALVSALQARNNARLTFVGSADAFTDVFFEREVEGADGKTVRAGNKEFADRVAEWTFQESGVLKVEKIEHRLANGTEINPKMYRVKNDIEYSVTIAEHTPTGWIPFILPLSDHLQLEFTMLNPYYRLNLNPSRAHPGTFTTSFTAPDQHGLFALTLNYKRPFLSYIESKYSVVVRHFAHDEYTRSWDISASWVWIAGIGVTVLGWGMFVLGWLFCEEEARGRKKKQ